MLQLQEIFRKKNEKKSRKGDAEKSAQLVRRFSVSAFLFVKNVFIVTDTYPPILATA